MGLHPETQTAVFTGLSFLPESPGQFYCFTSLTPCHFESERAGVGPESCKDLDILSECDASHQPQSHQHWHNWAEHFGMG